MGISIAGVQIESTLEFGFGKLPIKISVTCDQSERDMRFHGRSVDRQGLLCGSLGFVIGLGRMRRRIIGRNCVCLGQGSVCLWEVRILVDCLPEIADRRLDVVCRFALRPEIATPEVRVMFRTH